MARPVHLVAWAHGTCLQLPSTSASSHGHPTAILGAFSTRRNGFSTDQKTTNTRYGWAASGRLGVVVASIAVCVAVVFALRTKTSLQADARPETQDEDQGEQGSHADQEVLELRRYRLSEIKSHDGQSGKPWVTHGNRVYDITDWLSAHPGGDVILRAAGGSIDAYWDIFTIHKQAHVYEILQQYLIGQVDEADLVDGKLPQAAIEDPFVNDPRRDATLITLTAKPRNAETPAEALTSNFLTPNEVFYVRNHMWVPRVDARQAPNHGLTIEFPDGSSKSYTLSELQGKFKPHKITATLQCSGNRRKHMSTEAAATNGLQWSVGGISCAEWEGVRLVDVLRDAGFPVDKVQAGEAAAEPHGEAKHVWFTGLETYGASIPVETAADPRADVLLAYAMNGKPLPPDHGFPLRALVPGHVAARSVKWLSRIVLSDEESPSQWQRRDYKCFGPNDTNPDWDSAPAIQELPVTSAITTAQVDGTDKAALQGYAFSGGGREIVRVDVSLDGGKTWDQARLIDASPKDATPKDATPKDATPKDATPKDASAPHSDHKHWAWKRWRYEGRLPEEVGGGGSGSGSQKQESSDQRCTTAVVKATDDSYNSQPESHRGIFNTRGNLATAWHAVRLCTPCRKRAPGRGTG
jgi:sulfite oxidase